MKNSASVRTLPLSFAFGFGFGLGVGVGLGHLHMTSSKWQQQPKFCAKHTDAPAECKNQQERSQSENLVAATASQMICNFVQIHLPVFPDIFPYSLPLAIISWQSPSVWQPRTKLEPRRAEISTARRQITQGDMSLENNKYLQFEYYSFDLI